jgi:RND family efflux transporter MFP subunit
MSSTIGVARLGLLTLAIAPWFAACGDRADAQAGPPAAPPVSVAPAVQRMVTDSEEFSGRLEASQFVDLRPRIAGTIDKVHFVDGALVRAGGPMFTIDPRPFEAEVARAQSTLASSKAKLELARSELARAQTLLDSHAVSKQEVDQWTSGSRTSQADVLGAEAALRVARLNLEYTVVRAPISGRASRANVTVGNLVNEQVVLTTIAGVSEVYAYFDGSEQTYLKLKSTPAGTKMPTVRMALANEQGFPHEGRLDFVDNRIDTRTGAIRLRASFDNSRNQFTPGLAAKLSMEDAVPYNAVLVPERAIGTDQTKKFVYVVGADGQALQREVKLGTLQDGMRVVRGELKSGENVVVDGLQRIQPGVPVAPQVLKVDDKGMPILPPPAPAASSSPASAAKG